MRCKASRVTLLTWGTTLLLSVATVCCAQHPDTRIEHLLQAAVHLEQAELPEQAAEIRELLAGQDQQLKRRLLEDKLARIEQLRVECAQLQQVLDSPNDRTKVILRLKVLELSLDKLSQVGVNLVSIRQLLESESPTTLVDTGGAIIQFLEMLQAQGFAEVVAEPTLVTWDGRRAAIEIASAKQGSAAGQIVYADPAAARRASRGSLKFECTPAVGNMGLVQLDLLFRRSDDSALVSTNDSDENSPSDREDLHASPLRSADAWTRVEMVRGQTLILASRNSSKQANQSIATLLLLESETVAPPQEQGAAQEQRSGGLRHRLGL